MIVARMVHAALGSKNIVYGRLVGWLCELCWLLEWLIGLCLDF